MKLPQLAEGGRTGGGKGHAPGQKRQKQRQEPARPLKPEAGQEPARGLGTGQGLWRIKNRSFVVQHQLHPAELAMYETGQKARGA